MRVCVCERRRLCGRANTGNRNADVGRHNKHTRKKRETNLCAVKVKVAERKLCVVAVLIDIVRRGPTDPSFKALLR